MKQKLKYLLAVFLLAGSFFLKAAIVRAQEDDSGGYSDYSDYSDTSGLNFDSNDSASVGSYDSSYNYLNDPASYYGVDTSNNDQNNNASSSGYQDYVNNPNNVYLNDPNNPPISDTPKFPSGYTADNDPSMPLNDAGTGYLDSQGSEYNQELNSQAPTQVPGIENRLNVVSPGELEKNSPNNLYDSSQGYTMDEGSGAVVATPDPSTVNDGKGTDLPAFSSNDTITSSEGKQAQDLYNQSVDSWNNDLSASDAKINGLTNPSVTLAQDENTWGSLSPDQQVQAGGDFWTWEANSLNSSAGSSSSSGENDRPASWGAPIEPSQDEIDQANGQALQQKFNDAQQTWDSLTPEEQSQTGGVGPQLSLTQDNATWSSMTPDQQSQAGGDFWTWEAKNLDSPPADYNIDHPVTSQGQAAQQEYNTSALDWNSLSDRAGSGAVDPTNALAQDQSTWNSLSPNQQSQAGGDFWTWEANQLGNSNSCN